MKRAMEMDPNSPWLAGESGRLLQMQERYAEAEQAVEESLSRRPWFRPAVQMKGRLLHLMNRGGEAVAFLSESLRHLQSGPIAAQLMALKQAGVPIDGIAIRDAREDVDRFLARYGNPYDHIGLDARSSVQLALGSSGVPETFLIDGQGKIVHQHIGDIGPDDIADILDRWKAAQ